MFAKDGTVEPLFKFIKILCHGKNISIMKSTLKYILIIFTNQDIHIKQESKPIITFNVYFDIAWSYLNGEVSLSIVDTCAELLPDILFPTVPEFI